MAAAVDPREQIIRGLEDVIVCESSVSNVDGQKGILSYRGYDINDLAEKSTFEETAYLLLYGHLPTTAELSAFTKELVAARALPAAVIDTLKLLPKTTNTMAALRTAVSALGCTDKNADTVTVENEHQVATHLISQFATITAAIARIREGKEPIAPDASLGHAANFMYMITGTKPSAALARIMDVALILHADHEVPASNFSALVVASSMTDMYSAITAAVGSLKGPLHGGANEDALRNVTQIGGPAKVQAYVDDCMATKKKIPGIGHRVYKVLDPRARILKRYAAQLGEDNKEISTLFQTASDLEKLVEPIYGPKGIYPNVDFYSGIVYHAMGIPTELFTPIFAVSRIVGWTAILIEFLPQNRIFRPRALYVGKTDQKFVAIATR
jgi:citrate synthase